MSSREGIKDTWSVSSDDCRRYQIEVDDTVGVFDGQFTCCERNHEHTAHCDKLDLVLPILALYGRMYKLSLDALAVNWSAVEPFFASLKSKSDTMFPKETTAVKLSETNKLVPM